MSEITTRAHLHPILGKFLNPELREKQIAVVGENGDNYQVKDIGERRTWFGARFLDWITRPFKLNADEDLSIRHAKFEFLKGMAAAYGIEIARNVCVGVNVTNSSPLTGYRVQEIVKVADVQVIQLRWKQLFTESVGPLDAKLIQEINRLSLPVVRANEYMAAKEANRQRGGAAYEQKAENGKQVQAPAGGAPKKPALKKNRWAANEPFAKKVHFGDAITVAKFGPKLEGLVGKEMPLKDHTLRKGVSEEVPLSEMYRRRQVTKTLQSFKFASEEYIGKTPDIDKAVSFLLKQNDPSMLDLMLQPIVNWLDNRDPWMLLNGESVSNEDQQRASEAMIYYVTAFKKWINQNKQEFLRASMGNVDYVKRQWQLFLECSQYVQSRLAAGSYDDNLVLFYYDTLRKPLEEVKRITLSEDSFVCQGQRKAFDGFQGKIFKAFRTGLKTPEKVLFEIVDEHIPSTSYNQGATASLQEDTALKNTINEKLHAQIQEVRYKAFMANETDKNFGEDKAIFENYLTFEHEFTGAGIHLKVNTDLLRKIIAKYSVEEGQFVKDVKGAMKGILETEPRALVASNRNVFFSVTNNAIQQVLEEIIDPTENLNELIDWLLEQSGYSKEGVIPSSIASVKKHILDAWRRKISKWSEDSVLSGMTGEEYLKARRGVLANLLFEWIEDKDYLKKQLDFLDDQNKIQDIINHFGEAAKFEKFVWNTVRAVVGVFPILKVKCEGHPFKEFALQQVIKKIISMEALSEQSSNYENVIKQAALGFVSDWVLGNDKMAKSIDYCAMKSTERIVGAMGANSAEVKEITTKVQGKTAAASEENRRKFFEAWIQDQGHLRKIIEATLREVPEQPASV